MSKFPKEVHDQITQQYIRERVTTKQAWEGVRRWALNQLPRWEMQTPNITATFKTCCPDKNALRKYMSNCWVSNTAKTRHQS